MKKLIDFLKSENGIFAAVILLLFIAYALGYFHGESAWTAMAIIAGATGGKAVESEPLTLDLATQASPELLRNEIDERIVKIRPMATPIDQISRQAGARACGSMVVDYYSVDTKPIEATVMSCERKGNTNYNGFLTSTLSTDNDAMFEPSETIMVPEVSTSDGGSLVLYVVEKNSTGGLTVIAANNGNEDARIVPDLTAGTKLIRMGRAAVELDVQTAQFQALPIKSQNYCQIFKAQVEQSTYMKIANKEVGWNFNDQEEAAIIDMRLGMEKNFLFGFKNKIYDPVKANYVMLTGGIWNQAGKETEYSIGQLDGRKLVEISREAFTGNGGSSKKILIGGTRLIEELHNMEHVKTIGASETMTRWGLDFTEITTKFGRLYVLASEVFDQCGHAHDGLIVDPEYITKYCHVPFRTERLDLRTSGIRNTDAIVITESSCLVLRYPSAHMRIVGNSTTA